MKVTLSKAESRALDRLRGLPEDAHFMVMGMTCRPEGDVIEGTNETLMSLVEFISGELADGMISDREAGPLASLCVKIDPDCRDWLGQ